jgi:hypothetical protein
VGAGPAAVGLAAAAAAGVFAVVLPLVAGFVAVGAVEPPPHAVTAPAAATAAESLRNCRRLSSGFMLASSNFRIVNNG